MHVPVRFLSQPSQAEVTEQPGRPAPLHLPPLTQMSRLCPAAYKDVCPLHSVMFCFLFCSEVLQLKMVFFLFGFSWKRLFYFCFHRLSPLFLNRFPVVIFSLQCLIFSNRYRGNCGRLPGGLRGHLCELPLGSQQQWRGTWEAERRDNVVRSVLQLSSGDTELSWN